MVEKNRLAEDFWREFCQIKDLNYEISYQVWYFGNSVEMAKELGELVVSGKKSATASLVEFNKRHPGSAPIDKGYSVVTDFEGNPLCILQTTEIRQLPFDEVDIQFAFDEGEGNQTLENWRDGHWRYFTKEAAELEIEFNEKSLICCERFRLLLVKE
jgi:uncharacterized protein YhfF